jgi:hypothetical protein
MRSRPAGVRHPFISAQPITSLDPSGFPVRPTNCRKAGTCSIGVRSTWEWREVHGV